MDFLNTYIFGVSVPLALLATGLFFTVRLKAFYLFHPAKTIKGMLSGNKNSGISPFRATTMALAGTLGVGNIVGVASAIAFGGFGAVFWMAVSSLVAMILKYAEILLAVNHRRTDKVTGQTYGGAPYYIRDILSTRKSSVAGVTVGVIFTVFCILNSLTMGCVIQINAVSHAFSGVFGIPLLITGAVAAIICLVTVTGGATGISKLTGIVIPLVTLAFVIVSIAAIIIRSDSLGNVFSLILTRAFTFESAAGGITGFILSKALRFGAMRGLLSNEAGCGTAPIAHASADTDSGVTQGFWGIFEVFIDTILMCTITAIVIIIGWDSASLYTGDPIMMTIRAYSSVLGEWAGWFLAVSVFIFGISTLICWGHYGIECLRYFTKKNNLTISLIYTFVYAVCALIGAVTAPDSVWNIADTALGVMTLINLFTLLSARKEIASYTKEYFNKQ